MGTDSATIRLPRANCKLPVLSCYATSAYSGCIMNSIMGRNTRSSCNITLRPGIRIPTYRVCRTSSWKNNLFTYVKQDLGSSTFPSTEARMDAIEMIVCSWLIRYKHPISLVRLNHETQGHLLISSVSTTQMMAKLIHVLAKDLNCVLDDGPYDDQYKVIREYSGNSILIQDEPDKKTRYVVARNAGYILLKQFLYDNTGGRSATPD